MTCLVYKDGIVVTDGRIAIDDFIVSDAWIKAYHLKDGAGLIAGAGGTRYWEPMRQWIESGCQKGERPLTPETTTIFFDAKSGLINEFENDGWMLSDPHYTRAWGSGAPYATAAMAVGASLQEAVKTAIKCCSSCGGLVQTFDLTHYPGFARFAT